MRWGVFTFGVGDLDKLGHLQVEEQGIVVPGALLLGFDAKEKVVEQYAVSLLS